MCHCEVLLHIMSMLPVVLGCLKISPWDSDSYYLLTFPECVCRENNCYLELRVKMTQCCICALSPVTRQTWSVLLDDLDLMVVTFILSLQLQKSGLHNRIVWHLDQTLFQWTEAQVLEISHTGAAYKYPQLCPHKNSSFPSNHMFFLSQL